MEQDIIKIEKEEIVNMVFPKDDVLTNSEEINNRRKLLEKAVELSNRDKVKFSILFQTENGKYEVFTTIWSVHEKYIAIKGGIKIPIRAIYNLE